MFAVRSEPEVRATRDVQHGGEGQVDQPESGAEVEEPERTLAALAQRGARRNEQAREEVADVDEGQTYEEAADRGVVRLEEDDDPEHGEEDERHRHERVRPWVAAENARQAQ